MQVTVNGETTVQPEGSTVAALVSGRAQMARGVAVSRNGEVLPRSSWDSTQLVPGDDIELLIAVAGG